jgi:hypothetical protein
MTEESCMVCHTTGKIAAIGTVHTPLFATGTAADITISNVSVAADSGNHLLITFTAKTNPLLPSATNAVLATLGNGDLRLYIAEFSTPTTGSPSNYLNRWAYERYNTYTNTVSTANVLLPFGSLNVSGAATGTYTYTTAAVVDPAVRTNTQRIFGRVSKTGFNTGNLIYDFNPATPAVALADARAIVPTASCNRCHEERIADHGHGGGYNKSEACVVCHSPLLDETGLTDTPHDMAALGFDFPTMVHQIHGAIGVKNAGFAEVTYPAQLNDCKVCHTGGAQSDNYKNNPNVLGCTSCHTFVQFTDSATYNAADAACGSAGWVYPNPCNHNPPRASTATCSGCHDPATIDGYHDATLNRVHPAAGQNMVNAPEFIANLAITPPAAGSFYAVNETPTVTVTLKYRLADGSAGADVPAAFYTGAKHAAGTTGNTLSAANLYVYGPRTAPVPVLTPGAAVKPVATQRTSLLLPSTDVNNLTDATGFKYKLQPIPASMKGTFFVRFYGTNFGYVSDTNYGTDSNAFLTIQVGTATADKKISGNNCVDCHGTGLAPFHDARHGVKFDTDECISCHDQSGNHADPLSNRVHAVHSASLQGDMLAIGWTEVKYPVGAKSGGVAKCSVCHSSGSTQYLNAPGQTACTGCHADNAGALDHFWQNGGAVYTPAVLP